jgi:hypothetical protein
MRFEYYRPLNLIINYISIQSVTSLVTLCRLEYVVLLSLSLL